MKVEKFWGTLIESKSVYQFFRSFSFGLISSGSYFNNCNFFAEPFMDHQNSRKLRRIMALKKFELVLTACHNLDYIYRMFRKVFIKLQNGFFPDEYRPFFFGESLIERRAFSKLRNFQY